MKIHSTRPDEPRAAAERIADRSRQSTAAHALQVPMQQKRIDDQRTHADSLHQLQASADRSGRVASLHALQRKADGKKTLPPQSNGTAVVQRLTEVVNESKNQKYLTKDGEVESQRMGVEMDAYLDPWQPLHGTESAAFGRHGIYLDKSYSESQKNDKKKGATAMHLLNANLGGLAVDENLFPGHTNLNGQHLKQIESLVKVALIQLGDLTKNRKDMGVRVHYHVEVNPPEILTPEDMQKSYFSFNMPRFVNHEGGTVPYDGGFNLREDPDGDLKDMGWTVGNKGKTKRTEKEIMDPRNKRKDRTFGEVVGDKNDPKHKEAYRLHFFRGNDWNGPKDNDENMSEENSD